MTIREERLNRWAPTPALAQRVADAGGRRLVDAWQLLEALVDVDSSPDDIEGLDHVVDLMAAALGRIGFGTRVDRTEGGLPVLDATLDRADHSAATVLMVGHLDTVFPRGTVDGWRFGRDGDRATGPGVADAKGGAACAWLAAAAALDATAGLPGINLRLLFNTDEEAGSVQSRPLIEAQAPLTDLALIYEPGRPDGSIVRQRRGARRYRIRVHGRAAHTGVEPWNGVNALEAAARKILALQALNDRDRFLSVTVAVARGGTRVNVVPDYAELEVDARLPDMEAVDYVQEQVESIVGRSEIEGSSAEYEIISERPPLMPQPAVPSLLERFREAGNLLGMEVVDTATGGGSDGCFLSPLGVPTIDALGPVGGGYHTTGEFLLTDTLLERALLSGTVLASMSEGARS